MPRHLNVMQLVLSLEFGGMEKLVHDLVSQVDKQRIASVICCLDRPGYFGEELQRAGYRVYVLDRKAGIDWGLMRRLSKIIRQEKIDVIHAQQYSAYFYGLMASLYGTLTLSVRRPKMVYTTHGIPYPYQRKMRRVLADPVLSLFTEEIVTICEDTKANVVKYENFPAHKIQVIYNGIDLSRFSQKIDTIAKKQALGLAHDAKVVGIVARLAPVKNHAMLLRAFQRVLAAISDVYLLIVGDGPEDASLKTLAQSLGIAEKTRFLGARDDVPDLLQIFDVAALSSFGEGMSVTLLEAMGAGVPIVATNVGGNPEVICDQETGYLVSSDHDQEMAARLITLLQDEETRRRMGQAGQQRASTLFSVAHMVDAYTNIYLNITKGEG